MISKKIKQDLQNASWIRKMFEEGARLKKIYGADNVYDLTLGNPGPQPQKEVLEAIKRHSTDDNIHKYMPNAGFVDVREKIAEYHNKSINTKISAKNLLMTVGAAGGLNVALKGLLNPDDEVIVFAPFFSEYIFYVQNHNGKPVIVETTKDSFHLDMENIKNALTPKTKAIIINSPNNPTGVIYSQDELEELANILADYQKENNTDIVILSDEPYKEISYGKKVPNILDIYDNTIVINSMSKSMSLPGGRIGYMIVSPNLKNLDMALSAFTFANRTLGFVNAPSLYQKAIADVIDIPANVEFYNKQRILLEELMDECGFTYIKPEGAFYLFMKSPIEDDVEFVNMAAKYNILFVPGTGFGAPGYVRIAFCGNIATIRNSRNAFLKLAEEVKAL